MKFVIAIIHPEQLPDVKEALFEAQIQRFTVMNILGTQPLAEQQTFRGVEKKVELFQRTRVEIAINEGFLEPTLNAISAGCTASGGHGKVFVLDLKDVVNVSSGERGSRAV
jgi:nitrogen regulatory protein P-II 1